MSGNVIVVESDERKFEHWNHPDYGLGAQLDALGGDGDSAQVERIDTQNELFRIATQVKEGDELPARALVFQGIQGSELDKNPYDGFWHKRFVDEPADYDEMTDPVWLHRGLEKRPLSPFSTLISSRLIQRAIPDVRYFAYDGEYENWEDKYTDIFHWDYAGMGHDELRPTYGGFLARVNKSLSYTGEDFMSLVDLLGEEPWGSRNAVLGADIDAILPMEPQTFVNTEGLSYNTVSVVRQIGVVAQLVIGDYPGSSQEFDDIDFILPRKETVDF